MAGGTTETEQNEETENRVPKTAEEGPEDEVKAALEHYLKTLEKACDDAKGRQEYAVKQFDTLMIGLSTAALGFVLNYIKNMEGNLFMAHTAMFLFLACLLINLFSHLFSMRGNRIALRLAEMQAYRYKYGKYEDPKMTDEGFDTYSDRKEEIRRCYSLIIKSTNILSFTALLSAIVAFILFACKITVPL